METKAMTIDENFITRQLEDELFKKLKHHDWYYDYSDDGNVWRRGLQSNNEIQSLYAKYVKLVGEAKEFYNSHCQKDFAKK